MTSECIISEIHILTVSLCGVGWGIYDESMKYSKVVLFQTPRMKTLTASHFQHDDNLTTP